MDSLLPCQRWRASVMRMHKQHFEAASRLPAETTPARHRSHNMDFWSLFGLPRQLLPPVHLSGFPCGHASEILGCKWTTGFCKALPCPYLPPRSAHCSHNTINNWGEDEHCPVADGDNTYSLRSELTQRRVSVCAGEKVSGALPMWDEQLGWRWLPVIDVTVGNKSSGCICFPGASLISVTCSQVEQEQKMLKASQCTVSVFDHGIHSWN